jgi:ParB-like chromosome segregation protein Spo0J
MSAKEENDVKKSLPKSPFNPYDVIIVGVDDLTPYGVAADAKPDPEHGITEEKAARRRRLYAELFDERAMLPMPEERIATARQFGIKAPIIYFPFEGNLYVVDGRQRVKAARAVWSEQEEAKVLPEQRITVPGIKSDATSIDELFAQSRVLNVHTESSPMMRARDMSRLLMSPVRNQDGSERKRTTAEVAVIFGCSDQTVLNSLKLFNSSDTVKQALNDLKQPTIGLLIADLPEEKQQQVLAELKADRAGGAKVTVERAKKKVAEAQGKQVNSPKDKVESIQRLLQQLADKDTNCVDCKTDAQYKAASALLLQTIDAIARTAFGGGKVAFPTPIKAQKPGYTLAVIAKTGD